MMRYKSSQMTMENMKMGTSYLLMIFKDILTKISLNLTLTS